MSAVSSDIKELIPEMQEKVNRLVELLKKYNLPLQIFETIRTPERQKELFDKGVSKTLKSLHIRGEAADFVVKINGWSWDNKYLYLYKMFGILAEYCGLEWGGSWKSLKDFPHVQMKG